MPQLCPAPKEEGRDTAGLCQLDCLGVSMASQKSQVEQWQQFLEYVAERKAVTDKEIIPPDFANHVGSQHSRKEPMLCPQCALLHIPNTTATVHCVASLWMW